MFLARTIFLQQKQWEFSEGLNIGPNWGSSWTQNGKICAAQRGVDSELMCQSIRVFDLCAGSVSHLCTWENIQTNSKPIIYEATYDDLKEMPDTKQLRLKKYLNLGNCNVEGKSLWFFDQKLFLCGGQTNNSYIRQDYVILESRGNKSVQILNIISK